MGKLTIDEVIKHCDETVEQSDRVFRILHDGGDFGQIESKNYWEHKQTAEWLRELKRYKDLEESGRLIVLPCKLGETVYYIGFENCNNGRCIWFGDEGCTKGGISSDYCPQRVVKAKFRFYDITRNIYFTREEAEAALEGESNEQI